MKTFFAVIVCLVFAVFFEDGIMSALLAAFIALVCLVLVAIVVEVVRGFPELNRSGCRIEMAGTGDVHKIKQKAEQGDAKAQFVFAVMYHYGEELPQNYREAYIWYSLAKENGYKEAAKFETKMRKKLPIIVHSEAQEEAFKRMEEIQRGQTAQSQS